MIQLLIITITSIYYLYNKKCNYAITRQTNTTKLLVTNIITLLFIFVNTQQQQPAIIHDKQPSKISD